MSFVGNFLGNAAAVTVLVASAARPVSADRGPFPWDCVANGTCCFVAKPAAVPFKPPVVEVSFDQVAVGDTGLERSQVRRTLRRQSNAIEACFHRDNGSVDVVFVIGPSGGAHSATATSKDSRIATCVARELSLVAFPVAEDHEVTEAHVTISGVRR